MYNIFKRFSHSLLLSTLLLVASGMAHSNGVSGQGTWETSLQGRDLDNNFDNGFEAYYDTDLNITWLKDANYAQSSNYSTNGIMSWDEAQLWVTQVAIHGITGWRLPSVSPTNGVSFNDNIDTGYNITSPHSEMAHLYHVTLGNNSYIDSLGSTRTEGYGLLNSGPFSNVQAAYYWYGVEYLGGAWLFDTRDGLQNYYPKEPGLFAWAVHPGDVGVAAIPEPSTGALLAFGLVSISVRRKAVRVLSNSKHTH